MYFCTKNNFGSEKKKGYRKLQNIKYQVACTFVPKITWGQKKKKKADPKFFLVQ